MMEVEVTLDYDCCACQRPVSVLVKCSGKGLAAGPRTVAAVNVPCPNCGLVNQLTFEPSGTVRTISLYRNPQHLPQPSLN